MSDIDWSEHNGPLARFAGQGFKLFCFGLYIVAGTLVAGTWLTFRKRKYMRDLAERIRGVL